MVSRQNLSVSLSQTETPEMAFYRGCGSIYIHPHWMDLLRTSTNKDNINLSLFKNITRASESPHPFGG